MRPPSRYAGVPVRKGSNAANPLAAIPTHPLTTVAQVAGAVNTAKMVPGYRDEFPGPGGAIPDLDFTKKKGRVKRVKRIGLPLPRQERAADPYLLAERKRERKKKSDDAGDAEEPITKSVASGTAGLDAGNAQQIKLGKVTNALFPKFEDHNHLLSHLQSLYQDTKTPSADHDETGEYEGQNWWTGNHRTFSFPSDNQNHGNDLMHTFDLRDNENANIGNAMRVYRRHPTRGLEADHESLYLTPEAQGQGIGNELARKAEQFYRDHGVGHIRLHAAGTLGRYVWARHGYDFDPTDYPKEGAQFTEDYLNYLRDKGQNEAHDELARRVDKRGAPLHSWEIALHDAHPDFRPATIVKDVYDQPGKDFGFMARGHSGKIFLLSHHGWRGIKHLDGGIGDQIGRQYMDDIDRRQNQPRLAKSRTNPAALDAHLDDRRWHDHALDNGWEAASLHRQRQLLARLLAEDAQE